MNVLRQVGKIALNEGNLMAKGLFNVSDDELMAQTKDKGVSDWFCEEIRDELLNADDETFLRKAKKIIRIS